MASRYETLTDETVAILEKAIKTKPKDTKVRIDLHKKANAKAKELQKSVTESVANFTKILETSTRTLEEAVGVASSEVRVRDREIVRHLKRAIKLSKDLPRPKGWTDGFDKAAKTIAGWDPKADDVDQIKDGIKQLEAVKKHLQSELAAHHKLEIECNVFVDKAILEVDALDDTRVKEMIMPYLSRYAEFFKKPS